VSRGWRLWCERVVLADAGQETVEVGAGELPAEGPGGGVVVLFEGEDLRAGGVKQITYNGLPLYLLKGANPLETTGNGQGGVWHVVKLSASDIHA
jgi:hypothetical protein